MWAYLKKCAEQNIVHTEIMFDPQTHTERGIGYGVFMQGFAKAMAQAKTELGVSSYLILSFLRHLSEQSALTTLTQAAQERKAHPNIFGEQLTHSTSTVLIMACAALKTAPY